MNYNRSYNASEDWGWFVDIENSETICIFIKSELVKKKNKNKLNIDFNKLEKIYEDEYDYYIKNQRSQEILESEEMEKIQKQEETSINGIMTTTFVTLLLTYIIYFRL